MSGGRASRTASDNEHVITFHAVKLQSGAHQGGVPERPKGTGCKPVGSAYGGSNPPAPIRLRCPACQKFFRARCLTAPMPGRPFTARQMLNKVPEVTLYFWVIKVLCTTVGETASDYLSDNVGLGLTNTTYITAALLIAVLVFQFRATRYVAGE